MIPYVLELFRPNSVVDVGCGLGEWLAAFQEFGVDDILGLDGSYVDKSMLSIPGACFKTVNLSNPFTIDRTFDLAISLEVAEHLASENAADFIESLTRLAPIILFSAAVPRQGGTHHVNEQWPEYWVRQFKARGLVPVDAIRKHIWNDSNIKVWYRQNIMLFCSEEALAEHVLLAEEFRRTNQSMLSIIHPEHYLISIERYSPRGELRNFARKIYHGLYRLVYRS